MVDVALIDVKIRTRTASGRQDLREGAETERGSHGAGTNLTEGRQTATIESYACACDGDYPVDVAATRRQWPDSTTSQAPTTPAVILDPFGGTGTVAGVAKTLGRFGISNDLSESYNRLAIWRITQSGHFTKTEQRAWADRQGQLL